MHKATALREKYMKLHFRLTEFSTTVHTVLVLQSETWSGEEEYDVLHQGSSKLLSKAGQYGAKSERPSNKAGIVESKLQ